MFAKTIVDSDAFLDMPLSSQSLYFHLGMRADDDGFINNPKKVQRMIGASEDDLKLLIAKKFVISFESGVVVVKHWKINNYIRNDRYNETVYKEEKAQLSVKENGAYTLGIPLGIPDGYRLDTQVRLGKVRLGKDSVDVGSLDRIVENWNKQKCTHNINDIKLMSQRYNSTLLCVGDDLEGFINTIDELDNQRWFTQRAAEGRPIKYDWFVNPNNYQKVVEGNYKTAYKKQTQFNDFSQRENDFDDTEEEWLNDRQ